MEPFFTTPLNDLNTPPPSITRIGEEAWPIALEVQLVGWFNLSSLSDLNKKNRAKMKKWWNNFFALVIPLSPVFI